MTLTSNLMRYGGYCFCFLGCSYQIWTVVADYLLYETINESLIFRPEFFLPPDVSICFPYLQIINYSLAFNKLSGVKESILLKLGPQFNESDSDESLEVAVKQNDSVLAFFHEQLFDHHFIKEIMSVTLGLDSILVNCASLVPGQYALGPCMNTEFRSYVKDDLKCFQFKLEGDRYKYDLEQLYYWQYPHVYLYRIKFANIDPSLERMVIYIHPPNRWPAGRTDLPLVIITPAQRTGYNITFSRSYSQVLPSPYETDCHNYRYSRNQEIDRCSLEKILEWIGVAPPWLTVPTNSAFKTFRRAVYTKEEFAPFNEVAKKCFNTFPQPDCITEEFKPQLTAAQFEFNNGSFDVDINLPTSLDVENYMKPARTKIDLFIYIVNLLGFWFGIHVAALFSVTKKVREVKKLQHTLLEKMNIPMESSQ